jgi:hypothetical protein
MLPKAEQQSILDVTWILIPQVKNEGMKFSFLKALATNCNINKKADHIQLKNWHFLQSLQILNDIYSLT